ncbi:hypothetical protein AB8B02_08665 [Tardiphaga sp. 862_B3_N4_1]|uniref:hypothetical protein n=1 Tax=Tardiphaga sp. 862_B3_N4_1 TaxID=3240764 RepID=UPI003F21D681
MLKCTKIILLLSLISPAAYAGDVKDCDDALVMSTYQSMSKDNLDYRLASFVSESAYNNLKNSHKGDGNAVIYGVPVGASYSDYKERVRGNSSTKSDSTSLNRNQTLSLIWTGLDPSSTTTYQACLNATIFSTPGVRLAIKSATKSDISVQVGYRPGSINDPKSIRIRWDTSLRRRSTDPLPSVINIGNPIVVIFNRPVTQQQIAINSDLGGDSITLEPAPQVVTRSPCQQKKGTYNFDGSSCGDNFSIEGSKVVVKYGSGGQAIVPENNPAYNASLGTWIAGDFNADGLTDLAHLVIHVRGVDPYVHVHFSTREKTFQTPTTFNFRQHANSIGDYNANLGIWSVGYDPKTNSAAMIHDPKLPDGRIHVWRSPGDGSFVIGGP